MRWGALLAAVTIALAVAHGAATVVLLDALSGFAWALNVGLLVVELVLCGFAALLLASLRRPDLPRPAALPRGGVDVLIPVRNEDADVLRGTLRAAQAMRDPGDGFTILVVDDSAPERAEAIALACAEAGVERYHRPRRRGYKAGALNDAMARTRAPWVAVLDVDHQPEPDFLVATLPYFAPRVAFVQGIIEWRNQDSLLRRLAAMLQHQFYYGVQVDKGSRERAVFTGSAAVFSRDALDEVGGFPEETLVEDFDLTLRLTNAGWRGRLAPRVCARGLLPWTARDLARQLWRWSGGTTEVVALRARETLRTRDVPLLPRVELLVDGCAYLAGGALVAAAGSLILAGTLGTPLVRPLGGWALLLAPALLALAHVGSAGVALARAGRGGLALLPVYHLVSLAFTPVLFGSTLLALLGRGRAIEGRVEKTRTRARRHGLGTGILVAGVLGLLAVWTAATGALPLPAAAWSAFLGLAFAATMAVAWPQSKAAPDGLAE